MNKDGHYGISLLLSFPFIIIADDWYSAVVVLAIISSTMMPDKEVATQFLSRRGFTHTIWFVVLYAVVAATIVTGLLGGLSNGVGGFSELIPDLVNDKRVWVSVVIGGGVGVFGHLVGDIVVGGSSKPVVKPLWPVSSIRVRTGTFHHDNPMINGGLLKFMLVVNVISMYVFVW
jgi:membrane-bound metal-dependent hydrolase YbcI (DUF457 family)